MDERGEKRRGLKPVRKGEAIGCELQAMGREDTEKGMSSSLFDLGVEKGKNQRTAAERTGGPQRE